MHLSNKKIQKWKEIFNKEFDKINSWYSARCQIELYRSYYLFALTQAKIQEKKYNRQFYKKQSKGM